MDKKQKIIVAVLAVAVAFVIAYFAFGRDLLRRGSVSPIQIENGTTPSGPLNQGNVSPISGQRRRAGDQGFDWNVKFEVAGAFLRETVCL